ncbi:hypothetical protein IT411_03205, partial [Candidatus Peregrinibacteria bacterium]|nr:hypothetical protein [Candidatus Peregrinibacteria bacterium]
MTKLRIIFLSIGLSFCFAGISQAAGVVGTGTPLSCDEAAFDAALVGGGLITFDCGLAPHTITFTSAKIISVATTIDGNSLITLSGGNTTKLFYVFSGASFNANDLTLSNGTCAIFENGAAVSFTGPGASGSFDGVTFSNNQCVNIGGALYAADAGLIINNSTFDGNSAPTSGVGGLYLLASTAAISNTVFSNNSAQDNAALGLVSGSTANIERSYFFQNSSPGSSVLEVQAGNSAVISLSNFYQNSGGLAVVNSGGSLSIARSSFYDNSSGVIIHNTGNLTLTNSTIGGNDLSANLSAINIA